MSRDEVRDALAEIFADVVGKSAALEDAMSFRDDLALDSLDLMALAVEVHERFQVALEVADIAENMTVANLIDIVHQRLSSLPPSNQAA
jgi:acyl carrier protein